jgi:hypothetical protein
LELQVRRATLKEEISWVDRSQVPPHLPSLSSNSQKTLHMDFQFLARRLSRTEDVTNAPTFARPPDIDTTAPKTVQPPGQMISLMPIGHAKTALDETNEDFPRAFRSRSKSECLFLAKNTLSKNELPSPCQEYINQIQAIMARNDSIRLRSTSGDAYSTTTPRRAAALGGSKSSPSTPTLHANMDKVGARRRSLSVHTKDHQPAQS